MANQYGLPSDVVAARIAEVRKKRGWTAAQLAERCGQIGANGITAQVIANIESGRRDADTGERRRHVTVDELFAFAIALGVAPVHLLCPLDEGGYQVLPRRKAKVGLVRQWIRGLEPFSGGDRQMYFSEVPAPEWEAPGPPEWTDEELRKLGQLAEQAGLLKGGRRGKR